MLETHQNHSLPKLGTEKTPQWIKIPNLAWSYHSGRGLESIDFQFGSYLTAVSVQQKRIETTKHTATNISSWIRWWIKKKPTTKWLSHDEEKAADKGNQQAHIKQAISWNTERRLICSNNAGGEVPATGH